MRYALSFFALCATVFSGFAPISAQNQLPGLPYAADQVIHAKSELAPAAIIHAVTLQTVGVDADTNTIVEPCTIEGIVDAGEHADATREKQDMMALWTEQGGDAIGFARCALRAPNSEMFYIFAAAMVKSDTNSIFGAFGLGDGKGPQLVAQAKEVAQVAKWLVSSDPPTGADASTIKNVRIMGQNSLTMLHAMHFPVE